MQRLYLPGWFTQCEERTAATPKEGQGDTELQFLGLFRIFSMHQKPHGQLSECSTPVRFLAY